MVVVVVAAAAVENIAVVVAAVVVDTAVDVVVAVAQWSKLIQNSSCKLRDQMINFISNFWSLISVICM